MSFDSLGLSDFLREYQGMAVAPDASTDLILRGSFKFSAQSTNGPQIDDSYSLEVRVPASFPAVLPKVVELARKIPRDGKHHINPDDSLCLGAPLRLKDLVRKDPTILGFAQNCLLPYLYAVSRKMRSPQEGFVAGELEHGKPGLIADYMELFGLKNSEQVLSALSMLGMKRRVANKKPCPCGCGLRLGRCRKRFTLNRYRYLAPRSWYRSHLKTLGASSV